MADPTPPSFPPVPSGPPSTSVPPTPAAVGARRSATPWIALVAVLGIGLGLLGGFLLFGIGGDAAGSRAEANAAHACSIIERGAPDQPLDMDSYREQISLDQPLLHEISAASELLAAAAADDDAFASQAETSQMVFRAMQTFNIDAFNESLAELRTSCGE